SVIVCHLCRKTETQEFYPNPVSEYAESTVRGTSNLPDNRVGVIREPRATTPGSQQSDVEHLIRGDSPEVLLNQEDGSTERVNLLPDDRPVSVHSDQSTDEFVTRTRRTYRASDPSQLCSRGFPPATGDRKIREVFLPHGRKSNLVEQCHESIIRGGHQSSSKLLPGGLLRDDSVERSGSYVSKNRRWDPSSITASHYLRPTENTQPARTHQGNLATVMENIPVANRAPLTQARRASNANLVQPRERRDNLPPARPANHTAPARLRNQGPQPQVIRQREAGPLMQQVGATFQGPTRGPRRNRAWRSSIYSEMVRMARSLQGTYQFLEEGRIRTQQRNHNGPPQDQFQNDQDQI
ncbi:hypothetical protein PTTG_30340, partial [Puccinia triticina 1-1 BBBD Race 1]